MINKLLGWNLKIRKKNGRTLITWGRFTFLDYLIIMILLVSCFLVYKGFYPNDTPGEQKLAVLVEVYKLPIITVLSILFLHLFINHKSRIVIKDGALRYSRRTFTFFPRNYSDNEIRNIELTQRKLYYSSDYDQETTHWVKIVLNKNKKKIKLGHFDKKEANQLKAELDKV